MKSNFLFEVFILTALSDLTSVSSSGVRRKVERHDSIDKNHRRLFCRELEVPTFSTSEANTLVSFIAMGDTPYSLDDRYCLNQQLRNIDLSTEDGPSFMVHVGDIKVSSGAVPCNNRAYSDVASIFSHQSNAINYNPEDVFFVVGDNEWMDCWRPDDAWELWTEHFGPNNTFGFGTFRSKGIAVERQTDRSENFAFFMNNVLFIGLNIIGGKDAGDESVRLVQDFNFTRSKLEHYSDSNYDMKATVIFGHAFLRGVRRTYFGNDLFALLRDQYQDLPVMYLHGDGHSACVRYPDKENSNFVDVMVEQGGHASPIKVSVMSNPNDETDIIFDIDKRDGFYEPEGACPKIVETTWEELPPGPALVTIDGRSGIIPLGLCEGDCDSDSDCQSGLHCFKREGFESVPSCSGDGIRGKDYVSIFVFVRSITESETYSLLILCR